MVPPSLGLFSTLKGKWKEKRCRIVILGMITGSSEMLKHVRTERKSLKGSKAHGQKWKEITREKWLWLFIRIVTDVIKMNVDFFGWGISGKKITVSKYVLILMPCLIKKIFVCGGKHGNIFQTERNTHKNWGISFQKVFKSGMASFLSGRWRYTNSSPYTF